ncbi:MAG: helix-turn-helix transcriptional regulator [Phycisphaerae bacterium]|jgi:transcriptional regulator with XRE-family HTH domain
MSENFADRLRKIRLERGLSQTDLAKRARFQPSAISHFETRTRSPSFDNLRRLADALGVSIDYLLGRQSESTAAGPVADRLHRNFEKMSSSDQEFIAAMAEELAKKNAAADKDRGA